MVGTLLGSPPVPDWERTLEHLISHRFGYPVYILIRLVFQATVYMIWRERNDRKHLKKPRQPSQLAKIIDKTVRNQSMATRHSVKPSKGSYASLVPITYIEHSSFAFFSNLHLYINIFFSDD